MDKPCELCSGTGQRSYFKGESRFVLSWDDCPACGGTGIEMDDQDTEPQCSSERTAESKSPNPRA